ncbi:MAG TPA: sugar phosphate isomerase/epimerase family protein [Gaiellaceae bacterium]|nr:sugar phosphate isomerase/epimerase family protein [Gaiellaceae bacterium]
MEPRLSVSQITTFRSRFADDVDAYAAAGLAGIGIWELKLPAGGDVEALEALEQSGLARASAIPETPSILPLPLLGGPEDPAERVDAYCRSLERLAPFAPAAVVLLTGTGDRETAVAGLRTVAAEADRLGLRIALEPYQREGGELWSVVHSIPEAIELIEDAGNPENVGIQFDVWHLWNTPTLFDDIATEIERFTGVHICDWREPTRGWADRALPGDGAADVPAILRALDAAGWDGLYDIEIFSDDGTFGCSYDDSYWAAPPEQTLARATAAFERCLTLTPQEVEEHR